MGFLKPSMPAMPAIPPVQPLPEPPKYDDAVRRPESSRRQAPLDPLAAARPPPKCSCRGHGHAHGPGIRHGHVYIMSPFKGGGYPHENITFYYFCVFFAI